MKKYTKNVFFLMNSEKNQTYKISKNFDSYILSHLNLGVPTLYSMLAASGSYDNTVKIWNAENDLVSLNL